jgi:cytochrome b pre-mRNA-processing protein 3
MARGFYGRIAAYDQGLAEAAALEPALRRNLYGTLTPSDVQLTRAATYVRRQVAALAEQPVATLLAGEVRFALLEGNDGGE